MAGSIGAHLVSWAQTRIDSRRPGPVADLRPGALWDWRGRAIALPAAPEEDDRALGRAILRVLPAARLREGLDCDLPLLDRRVTLVHPAAVFEAVLVEVTDLARPLILFRDALPPQGEPLRVALPPDAAQVASGAAARTVPLTAARIRV